MHNHGKKGDGVDYQKSWHASLETIHQLREMLKEKKELENFKEEALRIVPQLRYMVGKHEH